MQRGCLKADGNVPYREEKRAKAHPSPKDARLPPRSAHGTLSIRHSAMAVGGYRGRPARPPHPLGPRPAEGRGGDGRSRLPPPAAPRRGLTFSSVRSPAVPGKPAASSNASLETSGRRSRPPHLSSPRGRRTNAALGAVPTRPSPSRAPMAAEMAAEPPPPPSPRPEGSGPSAGRGGERLGDAGVPFPLASPRGWLGCRIPAFQEARNVGWFPFPSDSLAAEPVFRQNLSRFGCRVLEHSRPPSAHSGAFLIFQLVFIHRIVESKGGRALKASQPQAPTWAACPCQVRLPRPPSFAHPET